MMSGLGAESSETGPVYVITDCHYNVNHLGRFHNVTASQCFEVEPRATGAAGPVIGPSGGMESPQMYDAAGAPPPPPQPDLKKTVEDKRQAFPPPDLDELNGQEISLDLQHLIEDQFRSEEGMALFQEILPGGKSPQPRYNRTTLAYMPQPVHSGASYAPVQTNQGHEQAPPIKEEPPEPHDYRRSVTCAQYTGQYNPQPTVNVGGPYGGGFTPLPPLGAPLLPPLLKHKPAPVRRSSGKVLDKGTDEYRRRRERNNIAVRKSREKAKVRSREVEEKVKTLLREKEVLLKRLEAVSGELSLHKQMYVHLINLNHPEITELCRSMLQLGAPQAPDHTL
ncbi:unnamed protein product [Chrysodeixis includens]|uniref:BZIP domain-containing protein n=2 Tax=Plusiinae TaxID=95186 RepID=A0A9N8Q2P1_CHRIL|nr:unnamed protein product [Chrysodeixis includens]